jgi:hypothetical protein
MYEFFGGGGGGETPPSSPTSLVSHSLGTHFCWISSTLRLSPRLRFSTHLPPQLHEWGKKSIFFEMTVVGAQLPDSNVQTHF